jgi:hypothetical protein
MTEALSPKQHRYLTLDPRHRIAASIGILPDRVPEVTRPNDYDARAAAAAVRTRNWIIDSSLIDIQSTDPEYVNTNSDDGGRFGMSSEDDDYSSDDGYQYTARPAQRSPIQRATDDADQFAHLLNSLPYCDALDAGFHMAPSDSGWCYCPFSNHTEPWRDIFDLTEDAPVCPMRKRGRDPSTQRAHLSSRGLNCPWHAAVAHYLSALHPADPDSSSGKRKAYSTPQDDQPPSRKRRADTTDSR